MPIVDCLRLAETLGLGRDRYLAALSFGNRHGLAARARPVLQPAHLVAIQREVDARYGLTRPFDLIFHGGSGSTDAEFAAAIAAGVVTINVDTAGQVACTQAVAEYLDDQRTQSDPAESRVTKAAVDPRHWGRVGETALTAHVTALAAKLGLLDTRSTHQRGSREGLHRRGVVWGVVSSWRPRLRS